MMRLVCKFPPHDPRSTMNLCICLGLSEICLEICIHRLRWYGHVRRLMLIETSWAHTVMDHTAPGGAGLLDLEQVRREGMQIIFFFTDPGPKFNLQIF